MQGKHSRCYQNLQILNMVWFIKNMYIYMNTTVCYLLSYIFNLDKLCMIKVENFEREIRVDFGNSICKCEKLHSYINFISPHVIPSINLQSAL